MKTIGTLGPEGTLSYIATKNYIRESDTPYAIRYFKSIESTLQAVGKECEYGILPIENYSEGFVSVVLDRLADLKLYIANEILLPIQFSFVANVANPKEIDTLYVQFVAKNQCSVFIESLGDVEVITTESNISSLEFLKNKNSASAGAIVPVNSFEKSDFKFSRENVNDFCNNQTRFLMFSVHEHNIEKRSNIHYKTSIIVFNDHDRPGLLESILSPFSKREINLTSLISRPTRKQFGIYNFFIGFEGHAKDKKVSEALSEIANENRLIFFGSYPRASQSES